MHRSTLLLVAAAAPPPRRASARSWSCLFTSSATMLDQAQRERMQRNRGLALHRLNSKRAVTTGSDAAVRLTNDAEAVASPSSKLKEGNNQAEVQINLRRCIASYKSASNSATQPTDVYGKQAEGKLSESSPLYAVKHNITQEFDYLVVIDFESTCDIYMDFGPQEIIEFPSVLVCCERFHVNDSFQTYVKPLYHPILTNFCKHFTGIQQSQVDGGVSLAEALVMHDNWLEEKGIKAMKFAILTWTDWDCKVMLESECKWKGLSKPSYFNRWINLKVPFRMAFRGLKCNLKTAVQKAGLVWEGRAHSGLDDAKNTARLALELMRRGVALRITDSFSIYGADGTSTFVPKLKRPCVDARNGDLRDGLEVGAEPAILCFCGVRSKKQMVQKRGPMYGKYFLSCGKWTMIAGGDCHFFEWISPE